ncbi:hypothetical protein O4O00_16580 [Citrobacter sedlakii]|uniref:hypothetical protein n=1 Tax=Citrobacter sedlakii TaxID=67826 RepID=UPI00126B68D9|nr:hypothetical protein [Citrobacter sedlakii]ECC3814922.1 hypothetical protein [Salmonella enterica subsp. enterica]ECC8734478.1 hypothetical protein [Salmonella bongori]EEA7993660.1 hypothetical protein [Salmonella enterica subsp. enterica]MCZ4675996.1 hypothetical protein [Citrobacter sedlakii]MDR5006051.1 hypothetical protein [Citrobacter sedlakii]
MRYYRLEIINTRTGKPPVDGNGNPIGPFDTTRMLGCGLHVEFDFEVTGLDVVRTGTMLTIYGLPIDMLKQSVNLQGCLVRMKAGFVKGLPLTNPVQQGEIIYGEIYLAYANWIGTNQTLNLVINPTIRKTDDGKPFTIVGEGKPGEKVGDVVARALKKSFPNKVIECTVSDSLVLPEEWKGTYEDIGSLAMVVKIASISMMRNKKYCGIAISILSDRIRIYDNASVDWGKPKEIKRYELIGQPTWIAPFTISFKCPLRGDIRCGDVVELPQGMLSDVSSILMTNTTAPSVISRNSTTFTGKFLVKSVRHIGSYLTADGDAWVTVFEAYAENWVRV